MNASGSPRFRFRTPEGGEVPVASVAELSNRVAEGELGPETPLFDAGTGQWDRAGDVPVFQFVVEELRAEGRLPEGWDEAEVVVLPDPPLEEVIDPGREFEPIRHEEGADASAGSSGPLDAGALPEGSDLSRASGEGQTGGGTPVELGMGEPTPDPFELHLPLSSRSGEGEAEGDADREEAPADEGRGPEARAGDVSREGEGREGESSGDGSEEPREPWFEDRYGEPAARGGGAEGPEERPGRGEASGGGAAAGEAPPSREGGAGAEAYPEAGVGAAGEPGGAPEEEVDSSPLHTWLTHGPPAPGSGPGGGGGAREGRRDDPGGLDLEPTAPPRSLSGRASRGEGEPAAEGGASGEPASRPLDIRTAWEDDATLHDPRALHLATRRRRRNGRVMAGAAVLLVVAVGGAALYTALRPAGPEADDGASLASAPAGVTGGGDRGVSGDAALAEAPPGLEEEAALLWAALPAEVARVMDSLRVAAELPEAPPREWLGGYYLANAGEFPGVVEFWNRYRDFVRNLGERDEALVEGAARAALGRPPLAQRELGDAERERLVAFVQSRQGRAGVVRRDRYTHLERTAVASLQLHDFLVENGGAITYTPALGRGVSADPVLEAVTDSQEVRRQLERHLDRVFEALDRTRGGGPPSLAGLRNELFGSLGRPL
jgi:hypothetical protein